MLNRLVGSRKEYDLVTILFTVYAIATSMALNHGDNTLDTPLLHFIFTLTKTAALYIGFLLSLGNLRKKESDTLLYFLPFFFYVIVSWEGFPIDSLLSCFLFAVLTRKQKVDSLILFRYYLIITSIFGIIGYMSFVLGIPLPNTVAPMYGDAGGSYINYHFTYLDLSLDGLRLCGLFNEPGYFGTILALELMVENFNFRKVGNLFMLLAGILTASMAFFVLVGLYVFLNNITKPSKLLSIVVVAVVTVFVLLKANILPQELVDHLVGRMKIEDGKFVGDNRSSTGIDEFYESFLHSDQLWLGYGNKLPIDFETALSYKMHIIRYGLLGALLTWGVLLFSSLKIASRRWCWDKIVFIICFFVSIYQRPGIFLPFYFLILFGGLLYIDSYQTRTNINN